MHPQLTKQALNSRMHSMLSHSGWMDGWVDEWTDGWIDRQINSFFEECHCVPGVSRQPGISLTSEEARHWTLKPTMTMDTESKRLSPTRTQMPWQCGSAGSHWCQQAGQAHYGVRTIERCAPCLPGHLPFTCLVKSCPCPRISCESKAPRVLNLPRTLSGNPEG